MPDQIYFVKRTSHVFTKGHYVRMPQLIKLNETETQPLYLKSRNCTASLMDSIVDEYPWMTIPCDEKLHAAYFCQPVYGLIYRPTGTSLNVKCSNNWLLLGTTDKCVLVFDSGDREISYYDSQHVCSLHNSSLLTVKLYDRVNVADENKDLKYHLLDAMRHITVTGVSNPHVSMNFFFIDLISSMPTTTILDMLFGRRLDNSHVPSLLPEYLYKLNMATSRNRDSIIYFADFKRTCAIVEHTAIGSNYASDNVYFNEFGMKCRLCSEKIKVSGIICEKPAESYIPTCQNDHFECGDQSCILLFYNCDHVADCLDNSDEDMCIYNVSTTSEDQFVNIPCLPRSDCDMDIRRRVYVHAICDGLYLNDTIVPEEDVCMAYSQKVHIPITKKIFSASTLGAGEYTSLDLINIFLYEWRYQSSKKCSKQKSSKVIFDTKFQETQQNLSLMLNTKLQDICLFKTHNKRRCNSPRCRRVCDIVGCPGMFRCSDDVCIRLSFVCDNTPDCILGADEIFCSQFNCPGYLKCRGEKKCVSTEHICDNHVDCLYSMDDELGCDTCPANCECRGYVITCYSNANGTDQIIRSGEVMYSKALIIKGHYEVLITDELKIIGLLFLNISNCKLSDITSSRGSIAHFFTIIADLSNNLLTDIHFLKYHAFCRVVFLDLSFNSLHSLNHRRVSPLKHLTILFLFGNNFKDIKMKIAHYLTFIDLQFIYFIPELTLQIDHDVDFHLVIKVTDSQLCCMLSKHTECLSSETYVACYGILQTLGTKVAFYCLSFFSLCISLILLSKQTVQLRSSVKIGENKKHFSIMLMNELINIMLMSLYLTSLSVFDIATVNLLYFKSSISCIILNVCLFISVQTLTLFRSSVTGLIALKIMYPFRHQCTWFKWIPLASGGLWGFATMTYLIYIGLAFKRQGRPMFDKLCSIGWCDTQLNFNMLHVMIFIVGNASIFIYILAFLIMYTSLKKHNATVEANVSSRHSTAGMITCKSILANISGIILMIYLIALLSISSSQLRPVNLCWYFFIYALSVDILLFCFVHICKSL